MNHKRTPSILSLALVAIAFTFATTAFAADTEKVLFNVQGGAYGNNPQGFVRDAAGNLYGLLLEGGSAGCTTTCGVVFKLSPNGSGQMVESILHTFTNGTDGSQPQRMIIDASGNLYVSTFGGGNTGCRNGCGAVVEISPIRTGGFSTTVLYDFLGGTNGSHPQLTLVDASGNLYGFENGGSYNQIFQLSHSSGTWTHKTIYKFLGGSDGGDGFPLSMDASGNIFGVAGEGGNTACLGGCGLVFELSPSSGGSWTKTNLYTFAGAPDGAFPIALVLDGAGNIFGTTGFGGAGSSTACQSALPKGCGTLYELSPSSGGGYTETVLHSFNQILDGNYPESLIIDSSNNLYTTLNGGGVGGAGLVEEFSLGTDGIWYYTILHGFADNNGGGIPFWPQVDSSGNVYGMTIVGGSKGLGVVFELSPSTASTE